MPRGGGSETIDACAACHGLRDILPSPFATVPAHHYGEPMFVAADPLLSVGSNDLVQFFYAADRSNKRVADRFDALSTPILRALRDITRKAAEYNKPVTLCGEMASQPLSALALVAIGYRSLSLAPTAVGPVKAMLLELDAGKAAGLLNPLLDGPAGTVSIREKLKAFAAAQGLQI